MIIIVIEIRKINYINGESCSLIYLLYSDIIEQGITTLQLTLIFLGFPFYTHIVCLHMFKLIYGPLFHFTNKI